MLADGLPLYGGAASALGPLDISPVDLSRVELIKGAASSLYGGQALGGVINMVSKQPTGEKRDPSQPADDGRHRRRHVAEPAIL